MIFGRSAEAERLRTELRLLRSGKKVAAIKAYRERTGSGLAEAKDAIEAAETR